MGDNLPNVDLGEGFLVKDIVCPRTYVSAQYVLGGLTENTEFTNLVPLTHDCHVDVILVIAVSCHGAEN